MLTRSYRSLSRVGSLQSPRLTSSSLMHQRRTYVPSLEVVTVIVCGAVIPKLIAGWSPTPVVRDMENGGGSSATGSWHTKPADAPPGWLPPPSHWQPGMPELPFPNNIIPPREGFVQWQAWEALGYYATALVAIFYFGKVGRLRYDRSTDVGAYWLARVATEAPSNAEELPLMDPFEVCEIGAESTYWADRFCMSFWAMRFNEFDPKTKEMYWQHVKPYIRTRDEFVERCNLYATGDQLVDVETLTYAFIPEENDFIDTIKATAITKISNLAHFGVPESGPFWRRHFAAIADRKIDSPQRKEFEGRTAGDDEVTTLHAAEAEGYLETAALKILQWYKRDRF